MACERGQHHQPLVADAWTKDLRRGRADLLGPPTIPRRSRSSTPRPETEIAEKVAIFGALRLYLNFVNLFQFLMMFMGRRR